MNESMRTLSFVGVAVVSIAIAWFVHAGSQPEELAVFAKIGTEFYPDFDDPTSSGSLEIIDYDENLGQTRTFKVEFEKGKWRIPSHYGYPADAEDRLEKAAASLIGITRKSLAGRRENAHERFGVLAPPEEDDLEEELLEGIGQRIILKDKNGNLLADYILGKRVAGQENLYFVRATEEKETYHAELDLDVSTKFADWIEKDLLKLDRGDLLSIEYSKITDLEQKTTVTGNKVFIPVKESITVYRDETGPGAKWKLDGLDEKTEEINTSGISAVQTALDSLELNGVRPKPQGLTPELKADESLFPSDRAADQYLFTVLRPQLAAQGFQLVPQSATPPFKQFIIAGEGGEFSAKSKEGLVYHMHLGNAFAGTLQEIEVGKTEVADEKGNEVSEPEAEKEDADDSDKDKKTLSRYLFIRVEFDEKMLGKAPVEPKEPVKPEGLKDQPADDAKAEKDNKEKTPEELEQEKLRKEYQSQLTLYKNEKAIYEEDKKDYDKRLKEGKAKADKLNERFGEWYYVIPATSYDNLTFAREDIVKAKEKEEGKTPMPGAGNPIPGSSPLDEFLKGKTQTPSTPGSARKPAVAEKPGKAPAEASKPE